MRYLFRPFFPVLFFTLFIANNCFSQSDWKNWDALSLHLGITKKFEMGINHLRSYNLSNSFKNSFNQSGINMEYDLTKRLEARAGFTVTHYPADSFSTNRFWLRGTYKTRLGEDINWFNGLQGEVHSANEKRFDYRVVLQTRLAPRKRLEFLRLSPSVSYWLYYNIGGNTIQYYDKSGTPLVRESPDGFHRGRFILNLNTRITNNFSLSLYYLNQHEFNLTGNDMNVINPGTGKITRPFNNYQVAGLSLSFSFDMYKKRNGKKNDDR